MKRRPYSLLQGRRPHRTARAQKDRGVEFHPATAAIQRAYDRIADELEVYEGPPRILIEQTRDDFLMPVTPRDLKRMLADVPIEYVHGLKAIFLLGGSSKQGKVFYSSLYCYGTYWSDCIFLHPYPRNRMRMYINRRPKPSLLQEYRRVGALVTHDDQDGVWIRFSRESLKKFYLQDVLLHELGHHVDRDADKNGRRSEGFADWFASEYGFRRRPRGR